MNPTHTRITEMYNKAKRYCSPLHKQIQGWRNLYDFNHYSGQAFPFETRYEDPTYTNVVDLAIGIILANGLEFKAQGWSPSKEEMEDSTQIEKFLKGLIHVNDLRMEVDTVYEAVLNFVRDGVGVVYTVWDADIAADAVFRMDKMDEEKGSKKVQGYREVPVRVEVIDPELVYMLPGGRKRWKAVMRVEDMSVIEAMTTYPDADFSSLRKLSPTERASQKFELIDYWEEADVEIEKDGEVTIEKAIRHGITYAQVVIQELEIAEGYDEIPYTINFFKPIGKSKSVDWGKSIIHPLESSVKLLERSFNRRQRQIDVYSSLPPIARTMPGRTVNVDASIGSVIQMGVDEDFGFPQWPGNPPDVDAQMNVLRAKVQQSGFSDVMMGEGANAVSGYALSQLGDQNRIRLEQPVRHLELFFSLWATKTLQLVANFADGEFVRTYGRTRGRDFFDQIFIKDYAEFLVTAELRPEFPNEESRKHAMATQVMGSVSQRYLMERYLEIEHPDEVSKQKIQEMIEQHPAAIQFALMRELDEIIKFSDDPSEVASAQAVLVQLQTQGAPGGAPGQQLPNPMQTAGMPSAGGGLTQQEGGQAPPGQSPADVANQMASAEPTFGMAEGS